MDAYREPSFDPGVDTRTGYRTRTVLCVPIKSAAGRVFAVAQLLNKQGDAPFDDQDFGSAILHPPIATPAIAAP